MGMSLWVITEKRYICTHPDHEADQGEYPNFSRWSDFQAHLKEAHPPTCPYEMCHVSQARNPLANTRLTGSLIIGTGIQEQQEPSRTYDHPRRTR